MAVKYIGWRKEAFIVTFSQGNAIRELGLRVDKGSIILKDKDWMNSSVRNQ